MPISQKQIRNLVFSSVSEAENNGNNGEFCVVLSTRMFYRYIKYGAAYTIDHVVVLETGNGGDTRWVAEAHGNLYGLDSDDHPQYLLRTDNIKTIGLSLCDKDTALTTGLEKICLPIPSEYDQWYIINVQLHASTASTSGGVECNLDKKSISDDSTSEILTQNVFLDQDERDSSSATTQPTIDILNNQVFTGDELWPGVIDDGTGAKGVIMTITLSLYQI